MDLNKVSLIGNLVKEPIAKSMPSGQTASRLTVATNYVWTDLKTKQKKESVEFHNVVAWGRLADIINQYLKKGAKVYIEGRLRNRHWTDKSGSKRYMTEVVADELIMLGHRNKAETADKALAKEEPAQEELVSED